jgi:hypothetical protein
MYNVLNFIHTSNFYNEEQVKGLNSIVNTLVYAPTEFGSVNTGFNYIQPDAIKTFSEVLNTKVTISEESGYFYKPNTGIRYNTFTNYTEWKFVVAIQPTIFTMFYHKTGVTSALQNYNFNYNNLFEWEYQTQILMEPGQGLFYRPWMFHAFSEPTIIQSFDITENPTPLSNTILVMGEKGSGKTTFSKKLADRLKATYIHGETINEMFNDTDTSIEGENRQAERLKKLAVLAPTEFTVIDFKCERLSSRDYLSPNFVVWMNTVEIKSDTFEIPKRANVVYDSFDINMDKFIDKMMEKK